MFDMDKYNKKRFSNDSGVNQKIKVLFLLFDKYVNEFKLNYYGKQKLINIWIGKFVAHEEYEVAEAFKQRKIRMWKKWRKIHRLASLRLFWRVWRLRTYKIMKKYYEKIL